jgi:hypothetical protein
MKKTISYLIIIILTISCCQNEIIASYEISDDKKYLIPFELDSNLTYISQQNATFNAIANKKHLEIVKETPGPESCDYWAFDLLKSSIFIDTFEMKFEFILSRRFEDNQLTIIIKRFIKDGGYEYEQDFQIVNCDEQKYFSDELFTDIEINGFEFNDILIFESCYLSDIKQIIYSPKNGIEYIDFKDGRYLKLDLN